MRSKPVFICLAALAALHSASPPARAAEEIPGLKTEYGELLPGDGARLRTIVTKPQQAAGRLPAVLFVQWLSCDSIELRPDAQDGWSVMLRRLMSESGMLWQRTEKSGVGESKGTPCAQLDYETELAHHRAALRQLRSRPDVDPRRIVVFGASMGSNYAPLVAADQDVAGVVVWGGGATTWFERMLRFERNALDLGDTEPQAVAAEVNARAAYFQRYLLKSETPAAIAASDPKLGEVWKRIVGTSDTGHYGRPFAFHQQAQKQNWAGAWARVRAPVLVLYGEYDWFESHDAAQLIANIVNDRTPGSATFRELPQLDHHFTRYASRRDAFREKDGKESAGPAVTAILDWLSQIGVRGRDSRARNVLDLGVAAMGGRDGLAALGSQAMTAIELNAALPAAQFVPPQQFVAVRHAPESPQLEKISESLYLIRGPYNVMFSVSSVDVVVFEAPMSAQYGAQILQLVRSVARAKPIRYVVASHFHYDHLAGLGAFVAEHVPIVAPPDAKETIEKAMSLKALAPQIEVVSKQRTFDRDDVRARVYDFGPAPHVAQILGAYFPDEKLLYVADLLDVLTEDLVIAGVDAVPMRKKIDELGLDVERFVPVHGLPITGEQLAAAYRIRAKYVRSAPQSARSSSL
jgi:glyoxylase-like metal-dependent hydrolase (beta-lactamase superfamily II)/dienelactone hydrolase